MTTNGTERSLQRVQQALDDLPEEQLLAVFSAALEHRPALAKVRDDVMAAMYTGLGAAGTLDWSHATATHIAGQVQIEVAARQSVLDSPMLTAEQVADLVRSTNNNRREAGSAMRRQGRAVGLEVGGRTVFPAFQFDHARARLRPVVAEINRQLGAASDSWGVASWWLAPSVWRADGASPADLAAKGDEEAVRSLAAAETEGY